MSARIDAVAARVQTALTTKQVNTYFLFLFLTKLFIVWNLSNEEIKYRILFKSKFLCFFYYIDRLIGI